MRRADSGCGPEAGATESFEQVDCARPRARRYPVFWGCSPSPYYPTTIRVWGTRTPGTRVSYAKRRRRSDETKDHHPGFDCLGGSSALVRVCPGGWLGWQRYEPDRNNGCRWADANRRSRTLPSNCAVLAGRKLGGAGFSPDFYDKLVAKAGTDESGTATVSAAFGAGGTTGILASIRTSGVLRYLVAGVCRRIRDHALTSQSIHWEHAVCRAQSRHRNRH